MRTDDDKLTNLARPVFLVRANLMFVGIRYKHLGYKTNEASILYCNLPGLCILQQALSARTPDIGE